jgi:hypothetical protein
MMLVGTRQSSNTIKKIEELRLNNKMKNDEIHKAIGGGRETKKGRGRSKQDPR